MSAADIITRAELPEIASLDSLARYRDQTRAYLSASLAPATRRAYQSDWKNFCGWCTDRELLALPALPDTVAAYLGAHAGEGKKSTTVERRIAAISQAHQAAGFSSPTQELLVRKVFAGIRRTYGVAPKSKQALPVSLLRRAVAALPETLLGLRKPGAPARRVRWRFPSIGGGAPAPRGSRLQRCGHNRYSAKVQNRPGSRGKGSGAALGPAQRNLPRPGTAPLAGYCGNRAGICVPAYRSSHRQAAGRSGLGLLGGTRRAGGRTSRGRRPRLVCRPQFAIRLGDRGGRARRERASIMEQTGHKSLKQVRRYIRRATVFQDNAAALAGL
jgi:hypothetical protein